MIPPGTDSSQRPGREGPASSGGWERRTEQRRRLEVEPENGGWPERRRRRCDREEEAEWRIELSEAEEADRTAEQQRQRQPEMKATEAVADNERVTAVVAEKRDRERREEDDAPKMGEDALRVEGIICSLPTDFPR